jgi:hypothetical protein
MLHSTHTLYHTHTTADIHTGFPDLLHKDNGFDAAREILTDMSLLSRTEFYVGLYMSTVR